MDNAAEYQRVLSQMHSGTEASFRNMFLVLRPPCAFVKYNEYDPLTLQKHRIRCILRGNQPASRLDLATTSPV
jgi:hypothetical protein